MKDEIKELKIQCADYYKRVNALEVRHSKDAEQLAFQITHIKVLIVDLAQAERELKEARKENSFLKSQLDCERNLNKTPLVTIEKLQADLARMQEALGKIIEPLTTGVFYEIELRARILIAKQALEPPGETNEL